MQDVPWVLRQSYWTDEAWVAVASRFPLSDLRAVTSSTPIGFTFLVRLVSLPGTQSARLLPLAFSGASVVVAYWLGRGLGWRDKRAAMAAGFLAAVGVLLVPGMLVSDDLKQYTAEAFTVLLTLAVLSRLERQWSVTWLAALSASVLLGMLLSDAIVFAGSAAFVALCLVQLARRSWRRLWQPLAAGAGTGLLMLVVYKAFDAAAQTSLGASRYWLAWYVPVSRGAQAVGQFITGRFGELRAYFGLGPTWLVIALILVGLVTIAWQRRPATAVAVAVLWVELFTASALQKYPFLNLRTSVFLFAVTAAVAGIGVIGLCLALRRWLRAGVALLAAAALAGFTYGAIPYARTHAGIPFEDVAQQTHYVERHAAADDIVMVSVASNFGFAYYWTAGEPARMKNTDRQGYVAYFPGQPRIVVLGRRDLVGVGNAVTRALAEERGRACTRIWLVRTHVIPSEAAAWRSALTQRHLTAVRAPVPGLTYVQPGEATCGSRGQ